MSDHKDIKYECTQIHRINIVLHHSKVATITEASVYPGASKVTTNQYDDFGNNTAITIDGLKPDGSPVTRKISFSYNGPFHQLSKIDGPRTDVSDIYTIDHYPDEAAQGNNRTRMKRVTVPLGITLYDNKVTICT